MKITVGQEQWLKLERQSMINQITRLKSLKEEKNSLSNHKIAEDIEMLDNRKREINRILATSEVVKNPNTRRMEIGSKARVFVKMGTDDRELLEVELIERKVGITPTDDYYLIEIDSPLGRAIFRKEVGEKARFRTMEGYRAQAEIVAIEFEREGLGKTILKRKN